MPVGAVSQPRFDTARDVPDLRWAVPPAAELSRDVKFHFISDVIMSEIVTYGNWKPSLIFALHYLQSVVTCCCGCNILDQEQSRQYTVNQSGITCSMSAYKKALKVIAYSEIRWNSEHEVVLSLHTLEWQDVHVNPVNTKPSQ